MLNVDHVGTIQAALGYLLDENYAADQDREGLDDSWLEQRTGVTPAELRAAIFELAHPQTMLTDGPDSGLIAAARALNENLPDSLPMTDDICSREDVQEQLQTVREHERALSNELARDALRTKRGWLVPAPWDGPELALEPESQAGTATGSGIHISEGAAVLEQARSLLESEQPHTAEQALARVMLAAGALYARGAGTLSQCMRTAVLWERG